MLFRRFSFFPNILIMVFTVDFFFNNVNETKNTNSSGFQCISQCKRPEYVCVWICVNMNNERKRSKKKTTKKMNRNSPVNASLVWRTICGFKMKRFSISDICIFNMALLAIVAYAPNSLYLFSSSSRLNTIFENFPVKFFCILLLIVMHELESPQLNNEIE